MRVMTLSSIPVLRGDVRQDTMVSVQQPRAHQGRTHWQPARRAFSLSPPYILSLQCKLKQQDVVHCFHRRRRRVL